MSSTYGIGNALIGIISAPSKALDEVRERVSWLWLPLFLVIALTIASSVVYLAWVDFDWLVEQSVSEAMQSGAEPSAEASIRVFMQPGTMMVFSAISILVFTLLIFTLQSIYLHIVNRVTGNPELRFSQWFALSAWTTFPMVLMPLSTFGLLALVANRQLVQSEVSPLSLQSLVIHAEAGSRWASWGSSISLITFWSIGLLALGIMRWTGASTLKAIIIAAVPSVFVFGTWAFVIA